MTKAQQLMNQGANDLARNLEMANRGLPNRTSDGFQIVYGVIPSKSNCYKIITFKPKKDAQPERKICPKCEGKSIVDPKALFFAPPCSECEGQGYILKEPRTGYSLGKTKELTDYENAFDSQAGLYRNHLIDEEFALILDVYYPSKRADLDNSLKIILDCLQKKVKAITNDNKCVKIIAERKIDKERPRIEFKLMTYKAFLADRRTLVNGVSN